MQHRLKRLLALALTVIVGMSALAQANNVQKGVVRVKLQPTVAKAIGKAPRKAAAGNLTVNVSTLDASLKAIKTISVKPVFPDNPKYAAERAKYGLDQWYEITFAPEVSVAEAQRVLTETPGVQRTSVRKKMVLYGDNGKYVPFDPTKVKTRVPAASAPFNDPRLGYQWHYYNDGSMNGSVAGADINLYEAWKQTTGSPDVIVAIIDGGIDINHQDLKANLLVNEAELNGTSGADNDNNGYPGDVFGWNFCTNTPNIYPHNHGTHVAGTVAAVNNNGIGVCGVAGGDGTPDSGIRMLSCQVFDSRQGVGDGDFAAALVYAAERGATIAQCSWGWGEPGYYEQDVLDAINYFNKMARNDKMTGGLCIFASGNEGSTGDYYPGCMSEVLTVGAMTPAKTVASYSNYGPWVDVCAPGGIMDLDQTWGVLSTLPNDSYGWNEGTSMACPHVSGIAALILSKYGKESLSPDILRTQIETAVNDLYSSNPGKEGLYGSGYVDAAKALQFGDDSAPAPVTVFSALPAQDNITVEWTVPAAPYDNVNHCILYYSTQQFSADNLSTAKAINVDTKFSPSGSTVRYTIEDLAPMTTYYIALRAVSRQGSASELSQVISAKTNAGPQMTVDQTSLDITAGPAKFIIGNESEGLLRWSYRTRTTKASAGMFSAGSASNITKFAGKAAGERAPIHKIIRSDEFKANDYPKVMQDYDFRAATIGEQDKNLPNSMAQRFTVSADAYPDGFNLTGIKVDGVYGSARNIEIYSDGPTVVAANLLQSFTPQWWAFGYLLQMPEQLYFNPGESFWVVVHFDAQEDLYPLGVASGKDGGAAGTALMSNDLGKTWSPLANVLAETSFSWITNPIFTIIPQMANPDWSQMLTLTPNSGSVKYGEKQEVIVATDGQPLCNGNYAFNLYFDTNESQPNTIQLPVTLSVTGQTPDVVFGKVVEFGALLVGQERTVTVEVFNQGYGNFAGSNFGSGLYSDKISSTSEHFRGPDYLQSGFPARTTTTFDITFAPKAAGSHTGNIVFTDKDGRQFKVMVMGVATDPAKITVEPANVEVGDLEVGADAKQATFSIRNGGNYPLQFVMPKYSDATIEGASNSDVHRFGYLWTSNLNGSEGAQYDGNPQLIDATDITSVFNDNNAWSRGIDLGFRFPFYGKEYETVYVNSSGAITMASGSGSLEQWPVYPGHYYTDGLGWISAFGFNLKMGPASSVKYAKRDGKFVVSFQNVLAVVYDKDYIPVSFHLTLSSNGDIEIFYDNYDPSSVFNEGRPLYVGVTDAENKDPMTITSVDMANSTWADEDERTPEGDRYMQIGTGTAIRIVAPAPNMIESIEPVTGMLAPGETATVTAKVCATDNMNAGETVTNLVINSNDLVNPTVLVPFKANVVGDLKPVMAMGADKVDFGNVFRTATAIRPVTVKNNGHADMTITGVSIEKGLFTTDFTAPFTVKAGMSKDINVTLPTETEGAVTDNITVTTDAGQATVALSGTVIGCPAATLSYQSIEAEIEAGTTAARPLTIENTGNEPLVWSLTTSAPLSYKPNFDTAKGTGYTYSATVDDTNVKNKWIDIETTGLGVQNGFTYYMAHDYAVVDLPFEFPFYGKKYNKMYIYNTGFVSFTERTDEHAWPEPPADFPAGSIYTNIIAPYWGMHSMDQTKTAGTFHYVTEHQAVISFMEYGNSMNLGVDYQLILNEDGSFSFQYKADENVPDAIIYNTFGVAGISNIDGSEGINLPARYIAFGNTVQFSPVVEYELAPGAKAEADISIDGNRMGGLYETTINLSTNIPGAERQQLPVSVYVNGKAQARISGDVVIERTAGWMDTDFNDPLIQMGACYYGAVTIDNVGSAPFAISYIENQGPTVYDEWFDEYNPMFQLFIYADEFDWITGEPTGNKAWTYYEPGMPVVVGEGGTKIAVPMVYGEQSMTPGTYEVPLVFHFEGLEDLEEKTVKVTFSVTPPPAMALNPMEELRVSGVAPDYKGSANISVMNFGVGDLKGTAYLDLTGKGEQIGDGGDGGDGGVDPLSATAKTAMATAEQIADIPCSIKPFDVTTGGTNIMDYPDAGSLTYLRALLHPAMPGSKLSYNYGAQNTYDEFKAAVSYVAPEGGFNLSHVYTLAKIGKPELIGKEINVEIIAGSDPTGSTVLGKATYAIPSLDDPTATYQLLVQLDRSVYVAAGQEFCVVFNYPAGEEYISTIIPKEESVVSGRYMAWMEGFGWFDLGDMFKDTYGSLGLVATCLETETGSAWAALDGESVDFVVEPDGTGAVKVNFNAATAPLESGNMAILVIKTNDPNMPVYNMPVYLDKNGAPRIETAADNILVSEGKTEQIVFTVTEPDADNFSVRLDDNGKLADIVSATAANSEAIVEVKENTVSVAGAEGPVAVTVQIVPQYGDAGYYSMTLTATDSYNQEAAKTVSYAVEHTNRAPEAIPVEDITIYQEQISAIVDFTKIFNDPDGDNLTFDITVTDPTIAGVYKSETSAIFVGKEYGTTTAVVEATDESGAKTANVINIIVNKGLGVNNVIASTDLNVYPNPVVETLYVTVAGGNEVTLALTALSGAVVKSVKAENTADTTHAINVADLPAAPYILTVTADGQASTSLLVIKK